MRQVPASQTAVPLATEHRIPQPPQLLTSSLSKGTHVPPQHIWPSPHAGPPPQPQVSAVQMSAAGRLPGRPSLQFTPQPPQFAGSWSDGQPPGQQRVPSGHASLGRPPRSQMQTPSRHRSARMMSQATRQPLQWKKLERKSIAHAPDMQVSVVGFAGTQPRSPFGKFTAPTIVGGESTSSVTVSQSLSSRSHASSAPGLRAGLPSHIARSPVSTYPSMSMSGHDSSTVVLQLSSTEFAQTSGAPGLTVKAPSSQSTPPMAWETYPSPSASLAGQVASEPSQS
jgi:hypothetical protein